jgi:hypothetical protein
MPDNRRDLAQDPPHHTDNNEHAYLLIGILLYLSVTCKRILRRTLIQSGKFLWHPERYITVDMPTNEYYNDEN